MKSPSFKYSITICLVIFILAIIFHIQYINEFPAYVHAWAMADRYALALGFQHNHFNFFKPESYSCYYEIPKYVQHSVSITAVDFPIHDYIPAVLMSLTGSKEPWLFRAYILLYSMIGSYFLYQLSLLITKDYYKSFFIVVFAITCPVFVYYQGSFLPTIPSLANVIIGIFFYVSYLHTGKKRSFILAMAFFTLATLSRTTCALSMLSVVGIEGVRIIQRKSSVRTIILPVVISIILVLIYYLYNGYLRKTYGSIFLSHLLPERNFAEGVDSIKRAYENWKLTYFSSVHYLIILGLGIVFILSLLLKKKFSLSPENKIILLLTTVFFTGCVVFLFAMLQQFPDHDYYFLDTFYLPLILFLTLLVAAIPVYETPYKKIASPLIIVLVSIPLVIQAATFQKERRAAHANDLDIITARNFKGSDVFLDSLGVSRDAKMLVMYSSTPNIPLILMDRKGYSVSTFDKPLTTTILDWNYDYVVFQNNLFLSEVYADYPSVLSIYEKVGANDRISVWKKSDKKQSYTLEDFTGLSGRKPVFHAVMTYEPGNVDEHWQNIQPVTEKSHYGKYSGIYTAKNDFGITYKISSLPALKEKSRTLYFSSYFFRNEIKDCDIVVSVDDGGKNVYYQSYNLKTLLKYKGQWEKTDLIFQLPQVNSDEYTLGVYIYNTGKTDVYVDDFEFKIY